jgi:hypothetical protein
MNRIVSGIVTAACLLLSAAALPGQTPAAGTCSNASLKGSYGVALSGTRPAPTILPNVNFLPGAMEQVIGVVIMIPDGNGNFTQTDNVKGSLSGITPNRPGTGTYTVNADCTGTYTVLNAGSPPIVNQFVLVNGGASFMSIVVSPQPVMVTAQGTKM